MSKYDGSDLRLLEEKLRENPDDAQTIADLGDRQAKLVTAYRSVCLHCMYVCACGRIYMCGLQLILLKVAKSLNATLILTTLIYC